MITQHMRPVYVTEDGIEFDTEHEARRHETLRSLERIAKVQGLSWRCTSETDVALWVVDNWTAIKEAMGERDD